MKLIFITFAIIVLDQLTKWLAVYSLANPVWFLNNIGFQLAYNKGVAFSLPLTGLGAVLIPVIIVIILIVLYYRVFKKNSRATITIGCIIGGALGNVIDRIRIGYVIDFIHIGWWPAFNLADASIVAGSLLLVLFYDKLKKECSK